MNTTTKPLLTDAQWSDKWGIELTQQPQAFAALPDQAYREMPGWNQSLLKIVVDKSEYHAWREYLDPNRPPREQKAHFTEGSIFHCALNEPTEVSKRFVVLPSDMPSRPTEKQLQKPPPKKDGTWNENSQAYQNWQSYCTAEEQWKEFLTANKGKEIVSAENFKAGHDQANAVLDHPIVGPWYKDHPWNPSGNELTLTYIDTTTKSRCKARIDALRIIEGCLYVIDTKGTQRGGPQDFGNEAAKYGYLIQAAFYLDAVFFCQQAIEKVFNLSPGCLIRIDKVFRFVAVEKLLPCAQLVGIYDVQEEDTSLGRKVYRAALNKINAASKLQYFPGYNENPLPLVIPYWARRQLESFIQE